MFLDIWVAVESLEQRLACSERDATIVEVRSDEGELRFEMVRIWQIDCRMITC